MKVRELIEELKILNPEKPIYATFEKGDVSHNKFNIERIHLTKGSIIIKLGNFPQ